VEEIQNVWKRCGETDAKRRFQIRMKQDGGSWKDKAGQRCGVAYAVLAATRHNSRSMLDMSRCLAAVRKASNTENPHS